MTARAEPRERKRGRPRRLATLAQLLLLIAAGFVAGTVVGVVWQDPGLVFAYFTGETEDVAWTASATKGQAAGVPGAEVQGAVDRPVDPQIRREQKRAATLAPPAVAAAPVGNVAVQVGAFGTSQAAERLANSLRSKGFPVYVSPGTKAGDVRWRVRVGPLANRKEAEGTAARLKKVEKLPTWILNEDAS